MQKIIMFWFAFSVAGIVMEFLTDKKYREWIKISYWTGIITFGYYLAGFF